MGEWNNQLIVFYMNNCKPLQFEHWKAIAFEDQRNLKLVCDLIVTSRRKCESDMMQQSLCRVLSHQTVQDCLTLAEKQVLHEKIQKYCGCKLNPNKKQKNK